MTIITATLAVALIATLVVMLLIVRQLLRHHTHCSEQWAQERRELISHAEGGQADWAAERRELLKQHNEAMTAANEAAMAERRELINRVQAPDRIPVMVPEGYDVPEEEPDEAALVGTITYDDDYGQDE